MTASNSTAHSASPLPIKGRIAVAAGLTARKASQLLGKGAGGMYGGRVALTIDPDLLAELSRGKRAVLITGTNGKSTTTKMTLAGLSTLAPVAGNLGGDNMMTGVTTALMTDRDAPFAALEVDEMNVPAVAAQVNPRAMILLNLSRDQLDRVGEIGAVEKRLRQAVDEHPDAVIVANCDDPLIASAAWDAPNVVWVAAGAPWKDDAASFPRTGTLVIRDGEEWTVEGSDIYRRPTPDWKVGEAKEDGSFTLFGPEEVEIEVTLAVPGRANRGNSAQAIAAAVALGAHPSRVAKAVGTVDGVAGRYQTYEVDGRAANLLLAKNPAGWQEAQLAIPPSATQIVVAVNGQIPDGTDLSWLWDVDFTPLKNVTAQRIIASGERAADLAVRLTYAGIDADVMDDPLEAIRDMDPGSVQVLANYTAFRDLKKAIEMASGREQKRGRKNV